jgi:hypothetical protein
MIQCPYCPEARPQTGNRNIFRHMMLDHPDSERGRAILRILSQEPLPTSPEGQALYALAVLPGVHERPLPSPGATIPRSLPSTDEAGTR